MLGRSKRSKGKKRGVALSMVVVPKNKVESGEIVENG
jgi:hypothetical protein